MKLGRNRFLGLFLMFVAFPVLAEEKLSVRCYPQPGSPLPVSGGEMTFTFSHAMVALGGSRDGRAVLRTTPVLDGEFTWHGTKNLVFKPKGRLDYDAEYRFVVPAGIRSLSRLELTKEEAWTLSTYSPQVEDYRTGFMKEPNPLGYEREIWLAPESWLELHFSDPVTVEELRRFLRVTPDKSETKVPFKAEAVGEKVLRLYFQDLKRGSRYRSSLLGHFPRSFLFNVLPPFILATKEPVIFLEAEGPVLRLDFSNPLSGWRDEWVTFSAGTQSSHVLLSFRSQWSAEHPYQVRLEFLNDVPAGMTYTMHLSGGIENVAGEKLPQSLDFSVPVCSSREPSFSMRFEGGQAGVAAFSLKDFEFTLLSFASLPIDDLLGLYRDYSPSDHSNWRVRTQENWAGFLLDPRVAKAKPWRKTYSFQRQSPETAEMLVDLEKESGSAYGLFGLIGGKAIPFDMCDRKESVESLQRNDRNALTLVQRSRLGVTTRWQPGFVLFWVVDRESGRPVAGAEVILLKKNGSAKLLGSSGEDGTFRFLGSLDREARIVVRHPNWDQGTQAFGGWPYETWKERQEATVEERLVTVFTDRDYYLPGDSVHVGGVVKAYRDLRPDNSLLDSVDLEVHGPDHNTVLKKSVPLDRQGGFSFNFSAPTSPKGRYGIEVRAEENSGHRDITVDFFQANTIDLKMAELKPSFVSGETFRTEALARFLSGAPLAGGEIAYRLDFIPTGGYDWGFYPFAGSAWQEYCFCLDRELQGEEEVEIEADETLDAGGKFVLERKLEALEFSDVRQLFFSIRASTNEGREVSRERRSWFFPGERMAGIKVPYAYKVGPQVSASLVMLDSEGRPAAGRASLSLHRRNGRNWERVRDYPPFELKGPGDFSFVLDQSGYYLLRCDAVDGQGRVVSTSANFWAERGGRVVAVEGAELLELVAVRLIPGADGRPAEAEVTLRSPARATVLLTLERQRLLAARVVEVEGESRVRLPVSPEYAPLISIVATALIEGEFVATEPIELRMNEDKRLAVTLALAKKELEPKTAGEVRVLVRDGAGRGKKANLFVWGVDEGMLALSDYQAPDLFASWYPGWCYGLTLNDFSFPLTRLLTIGLANWDLPKKPEGLWGRVVSADGLPLAGVRCTLRSNVAGVLETITSAHGYFLFADVARFNSESVLRLERAGFAQRLVPLADRSWSMGFQPQRLVLYKSDQESRRAELLALGSSRLLGQVVLQDDEDSQIPGVTVLLDGPVLREAVTGEEGQFSFRNLPAGTYRLTFLLEGFKTLVMEGITLSVGSRPYLFARLAIGTIQESVMVTSGAAVIDVRSTAKGTTMSSSAAQEIDFSSVPLRFNEQPLLFFQKLETDEAGEAVIRFQTSDRLSTFRLFALAYGDDQAGSASDTLVVSKKLLIEEEMPESLRQGDRFSAGMRVVNRTESAQHVSAAVQASGLTVGKNSRQEIEVPAAGNLGVLFPWQAEKAGKAEVKFFAVAPIGQDGLMKKISVLPRVLYESQLDFSWGREISLTVQPQPGGLDQEVIFHVAPSILRATGQVARKLVFYPYECLEQRTSKLLPYLVLEPALRARLDIPLDEAQVEEVISGYLGVLPEFMAEDGGFTYYRGGQSSLYLTLYVRLALQLLEGRRMPWDKEKLVEVDRFIDKTDFKEHTGCRAFFIYIRSLASAVDRTMVEEAFAARQKLDPAGRAFLLKALVRSPGQEGKVATMRAEFDRDLKIEGDFAYYVHAGREDLLEYPFAGNRYITALTLQAILETDGVPEQAPRILNWLLTVPPYHWQTTHTTFWILWAMADYMRKAEPELAKEARITLPEGVKVLPLPSPRIVAETKRAVSVAEGAFPVQLAAERPVYLTSELRYGLEDPPPVDRGIAIRRLIYDRSGATAKKFRRGEVYQVELLLENDRDIPYGVIDEPLCAGFELLREDVATTRRLEEFNSDHRREYSQLWLRAEHVAENTVYYSYGFGRKVRVVYFLKALYSGTFTWLPTQAVAMYHPQYFGRGLGGKVTILE